MIARLVALWRPDPVCGALCRDVAEEVEVMRRMAR